MPAAERRREGNARIGIGLLVIVAGVGVWLYLTRGRHTYKNEEFGYKIDVPDGWKEKDRGGGLMVFFEPLQDKDDRFREYIEVYAKKTSSKLSAQMLSAQLDESLAEFGKRIVNLELSVGQRDDTEVHRRLFLDFRRGVKAKALVYAFGTEKGTYVVRCFAEQGKFKDYEKLYEKVCASISLP